MAAVDTALPVSLDRASSVPLAVQLADALRATAADGHLRGGDRLPSTRALAGRLGVSRTVTAAAYEQLHAEGWIAGRHGSGTYVTTSPPEDRPARPAERADPDVGADLLELVPGVPWADGIDRAAWRRAWRAAADSPPSQRTDREGLTEY
ncbi:MAG: GntR family transcriptional regulator, partial [Haloechinothrix sp.]